MLSVGLVGGFSKYLGMPMDLVGNMIKSFDFINDNVQNCVESLNGLCLSRGEKE